MNLKSTNNNIGLTFGALLLASLTAFAGYRADASQPPEITSEDPAPEAEVLDFASIKAQIFEAHCTRCHNDARESKGVNLEYYDRVFPIVDKIRDAVETDRMPRRAAALTAEEKELLFAWIDQGAVEVVTEGGAK